VVLGLIGLGAAGVVGGASFSRRLSEWLAPVELRDPTGLLSTLPLGPVFRFYSVTGSVPSRDATTYRLAVGGLVARPATYRLADLRALPRTSFTSDFHCVTGWVVPGVAWAGVRLSELLDRAQPSPSATAVRFRSFDGVYTESCRSTRPGESTSSWRWRCSADRSPTTTAGRCGCTSTASTATRAPSGSPASS
jgi:DMSO/TMAO reductase YedYZ molybdopterin-dependent catalytic subunit